MKKIMISLLMAAATVNAFAVTYTSKAKLTLKSSDNKSCSMIIAESEDLSAGVNDGYCAVLNEEGYDVQLYAEFGGKKYQNFASNAATMEDLQLGIKTNASTSYTLTASNVSGSKAFKIKINGVEYTVSAGLNEAITLPASSTLPAAGDEDKYKINPAPAVPGICNNYDKLQITGYAGAKLEVLNYADKASVFDETVTGDNAEIDLEAKGLTANTQYFVKLTPAGATAALEYVIKFKPAVTNP